MTSIDATQQTTAFGMKTAVISRPEVDSVVTSLQERLPDLKVILTLRDDWALQLGSTIRGHRTGKWHSWLQGVEDDVGSFAIERSLFVDYANICRSVIGRLLDLKRTHEVFCFSYERDILGGGDPEYQRLFDFLDLPRVKIRRLESTQVAPPPEEFGDKHFLLG